MFKIIYVDNKRYRKRKWKSRMVNP